MLHVFSEFGWPSTLVMDGGLNMSKAAVTNILALVGAEGEDDDTRGTQTEFCCRKNDTGSETGHKEEM